MVSYSSSIFNRFVRYLNHVRKVLSMWKRVPVRIDSIHDKWVENLVTLSLLIVVYHYFCLYFLNQKQRQPQECGLSQKVEQQELQVCFIFKVFNNNFWVEPESERSSNFGSCAKKQAGSGNGTLTTANTTITVLRLLRYFFLYLLFHYKRKCRLILNNPEYTACTLSQKYINLRIKTVCVTDWKETTVSIQYILPTTLHPFLL